MYKRINNYKSIIALCLLTFSLSSCSNVLITNRKQLNLVSDSQVNTMALNSYNEFMNTAKISSNSKYNAAVSRVGTKLANAVENYLKKQNLSNEIKELSWSFNVVVDEQVNAFCMPGGKIVFYEGIMPYCNNDTLIAVVMSHEIAHAIAKHSKERMSQQLATQYGAALLGGLLSKKSETTQTIAQGVYGLGTQYGIMLPYSRAHEYEADKLGIIFMSMAGYNPNRAVDFWESMAKKSSGKSTPSFLSTHPSDENRIKQIKENIPLALSYAKDN